MSGPQSGPPTRTNVTPLGTYLSSKGADRGIVDEQTPVDDGGKSERSIPDPDGIPDDLDPGPDDGWIDPAESQFEGEEPRDWAWVEEWRAGGEPVPWGPGLTVAGFALFVVASAVYVLSSGLSDRPLLAIGVNLVVAGGLGPALWLSRGLPVLRWIAGGAVIGVLAAWASVLIFLT